MSWFEFLKVIFPNMTLERLCVGGILAAVGGAVLGLAMRAQTAWVSSILAFLCVFAMGLGFYVLLNGNKNGFAEGISH